MGTNVLSGFHYSCWRFVPLSIWTSCLRAFFFARKVDSSTPYPHTLYLWCQVHQSTDRATAQFLFEQMYKNMVFLLLRGSFVYIPAVTEVLTLDSVESDLHGYQHFAVPSPRNLRKSVEWGIIYRDVLIENCILMLYQELFFRRPRKCTKWSYRFKGPLWFIDPVPSSYEAKCRCQLVCRAAIAAHFCFRESFSTFQLYFIARISSLHLSSYSCYVYVCLLAWRPDFLTIMEFWPL